VARATDSKNQSKSPPNSTSLGDKTGVYFPFIYLFLDWDGIADFVFLRSLNYCEDTL